MYVCTWGGGGGEGKWEGKWVICIFSLTFIAKRVHLIHTTYNYMHCFTNERQGLPVCYVTMVTVAYSQHHRMN